MPIKGAGESSDSPPPTDLSRCSATLLPSMNIAIFQFDVTLPSGVQPEVPVEMAKVLNVTWLVVIARTWGTIPACPSNALLPTPQLPTLFSPAAMAATGNAASTATAQSFFILRPCKVDRDGHAIRISGVPRTAREAPTRLF